MTGGLWIAGRLVSPLLQLDTGFGVELLGGWLAGWGRAILLSLRRNRLGRYRPDVFESTDFRATELPIPGNVPSADHPTETPKWARALAY